MAFARGSNWKLLQNRLDESPIFLLAGLKEGFHFSIVASTGDVEETAATGSFISSLMHRIGGLAEAISGRAVTLKK